MSRAKILAGCIAIATVGVVGAAQASLYVGVGAGAVRLDPDVGENLSIKDDGRDIGFKAIVGKRVARRVAVELFYTSLGTAEFEPAGEVDYSVYGLNTVLALNTPVRDSKSPQFFVNLGIGAINTESENTATNRDSDVLVNAGVGAAFPLPYGMSLRANLEGFGRDASMFSAVLIKEWGACQSGRCANGKKKITPSQHGYGPAEKLPEITTSTAVASESDGGETLDLLFGKPAVVEPDVPVEQPSDLNENLSQLENAYFNKDSAYITEMGEASLQLLIQTMSDYPEMQVEIQGHADVQETGSARALSELRVLRVNSYLLNNEVDSQRLSLIAYGDTQPASADAGNRLNRRVQFRILSVE